MLWIWTANLKEGKEREYKDWVLKNLKLYEKNMPRGWTHMGMYGGMMGPPDVCSIWKIKKFADIDRLRESENAVLDRLVDEEMVFLMPGSERATVLNEVENWLVQVPRKPKKK